jgi:hypothetical protein
MNGFLTSFVGGSLTCYSMSGAGQLYLPFVDLFLFTPKSKRCSSARTNFRNRSIATESDHSGYVRFAPSSDRMADIPERQLRVESRCDAVALGSNISVSAPFVWRCLTGSAMAPFSHPAHRTGQADFPHPALGQNFTPSPTARRAQACSGVRAQSARKDVGGDRSRPCDAWFCA